MSIRNKVCLPAAICSIALGLARVMEVAESGSHQSSARPRSSKGPQCLCSGGGPLELDTEDESTQDILTSSGQAVSSLGVASWGTEGCSSCHI